MAPPVIANSFPKSGTHLLFQILQVLPNTTDFGTFIASMPSLIFKERSVQQHLRLIQRLVPGEVARAHLFYHPLFSGALCKKNCVHFFIFRDPRDVAVSEAYYLTYMNHWHRMHRYYAKSLSTTEERISTAILGVSDSNFPYCYPDVGRRFERYQGWIEIEDVHCVRYEDLTSEKRDETIRSLIRHYNARIGYQYDEDELLRDAIATINPHKSHTFRKGKTGGWSGAFTTEHKEQMKSVAGELLIRLGYERNLDW